MCPSAFLPLPPSGGVFTASPPTDPGIPFHPGPSDPEEGTDLSPPDPCDTRTVVQRAARKAVHTDMVEVFPTIIAPGHEPRREALLYCALWTWPLCSTGRHSYCSAGILSGTADAHGCAHGKRCCRAWISRDPHTELSRIIGPHYLRA